MNFRHPLRHLTVLLPLLAAALPLHAQEAASEWVRQPEVAVRLVAASTQAGAGPSARLGLEIALESGWKTYWRSPGDAGLPVEIDWTGSTNLAGAKLRYPAPHRFTLFDFETFGYGGTVILPIDATVTTPGAALDLRAGVDLLVCADVCIPYRAELALALPAGPGAPSAHAHDIARFDAAVPPVDKDGAGANGLVVEAADFRGGPGAAIVVRARAEPAFAEPDIFVEGPPGWSFAKPLARYAEGGRAATLVIPAVAGPAGAAPLAAGTPVTLTLVDGLRAVERTVTLGNAPPAVPPASLLAMLAVALLGGLILNLMPCVLPVLAMKLAGVVTLDAAERARVRATFLATSAGIVVAFLALALALVGLKLAGEAVGWGLQFQQPWFLSGMALVVVAFAANLWGWFEIPLPEFAGELGGSKLAGSFATGVFATLLATPCSAPFVGTAVGFALAQGPVQIFAIFAALGLGLAAPYLAVAAFPAAARLLPRPGPWIVSLRRVLGLALAGTAAWLVWIVAAQLGPLSAMILAAALVVLAGGLFVLRGNATARGRVALAASVLLLALVLPPRLAAVPTRAAEESAIAWQRFERGAIDAALAQGKTVFVDVTADWCVTCQVNKRLVIGRGEVGRRLASGEIVTLRADWTRPDPRISAYLAEFGRYGIPFDAVYGPGAPGGLALPELLTEEAVLDALARAGAR